MKKRSRVSSKIFVLRKLNVFFKHTDYHGFLHPYNYFEWTSYAREAFFRETVPNFEEIILRDIKMMTAKIFCSIFKDCRFGDEVEARLSVDRIRKVSFDMVTRFYNVTQKDTVAETQHTVVFAKSDSGQFASIPYEMMRVIVCYGREDQNPGEEKKGLQNKNVDFA